MEHLVQAPPPILCTPYPCSDASQPTRSLHSLPESARSAYQPEVQLSFAHDPKVKIIPEGSGPSFPSVV